MDILLVWLLGAFIAPLLAALKKRDPSLVFVISLLLSPLVGVIVACALMPADELERENIRKGKWSLFRMCPECEELVRRGARRCRHCQSDLDPLPAQTVIQTRAAPDARTVDL